MGNLSSKYSNEGEEISVDRHRNWDEQVRFIAGGLTIMRSAVGNWVSPNGDLFVERMIPCRVHCSRNTIEKIIQLTLEFYEQEAVLAYKISDEVILTYK